MQKKDIPNLLTYSRYAAILLLLLFWLSGLPWLAFCVVAAACLTDFFDGYLARKWNAQSELGRLLDPNADKLLIAIALLLLASDGSAPILAVSAILGRELFVSGLREFAAERALTLHVTALAKWKTATQMVAVLTLLLGIALGSSALSLFGSGLLWLAAILTLATGWDYWTKLKVHLSK